MLLCGSEKNKRSETATAICLGFVLLIKRLILLTGGRIRSDEIYPLPSKFKEKFELPASISEEAL
jgi:hypothetical protein